ncbi:MAG: hypothetical protein MJ234_01855 [bacterium]|nr:hypothetical protein [bacterium]
MEIKDGNRGLCVTCRHFIPEDRGFEFENIADTEYMTFRCEIFDKKRKEYFLMEKIEEEITTPERTVCEFWEFWDSEK